MLLSTENACSIQFSAKFPVSPMWFMRQEPSADVSMQRLDSSKDDLDSDDAQSQEVRQQIQANEDTRSLDLFSYSSKPICIVLTD